MGRKAAIGERKFKRKRGGLRRIRKAATERGKYEGDPI